MGKALKICKIAGCPNVAEARGVCSEHGPINAYAGKRYPRDKSRAWRKLSADLRAANPACEICGRPATSVHHKKPLRAGGKSDKSNLTVLCEACHKKADKEERRKSRGMKYAG